ncbi:MAG: hypothetical protein M3P06_21065 [Acidobacteriota bacterium]|nr:hypothetical protein [Acidobacteriota bacterium]
MLTLVLFVIAIAFIGERISALTWRCAVRAPMSGAERLSSAALCAILFWVILSWSLALIGMLYREWLLATVAVAVIAVLLLSLRNRVAAAPPQDDPTQHSAAAAQRPFRFAVIVALTPIVLWTGFLLWKGYVTPPATHDALVYHLPRAALLAQSGTYQEFHYSDKRIDELPPNYELLLATIIGISGHDRFTATFSTVLYLLFLIQAAAIAQRWWGPGIHRYVVVLVVAGTPLMMLHGAAHKNDLLVTYLIVAAFLWCGRWLREGEWPAALWAILAATGAAGTKPHGLILGALLAPVLIWGAVLAWRKGRVTSRNLCAVVIVSLLAFPLLGGVHYVTRLIASQNDGPVSSVASSPLRPIILTGYGQWSYLWQAPILIWSAPFSKDDMDVYVPWNGERWFWPRYDVHDSNFGWLVSLLVLLLPWSLLLFKDGGADAVRERMVILAAGIGIAFLVFPVRFTAYGYISAFPRYLLYLPVLIATLSLSPIICRLEAGKRQQRMMVWGIVLILSALFADLAPVIAVRDRYVPLRDVQRAAAHPGTRVTQEMTHRASTLLDVLAAPTASVDVYGGFDTWIYPVMGATSQRNIHFVHNYEEIRPDADWVLVDRAHQAVWGNLRHDVTNWEERMFRGQVSERDLNFMRRLAADPRYETIQLRPEGAQALFRRKKAVIEGAPR